jgi:uncharacterized membrane protein YhaH (DUF805 family)
MRWIRFFGNFEGRIPRKTFWLANIAVLVIQVIVSAIAAAVVEEFAGEAAGDLTMDVIIFVFLYPSFVITLKRAHDRDISNGVIYAYYVLLMVYQLVLFAGWAHNLNPDPAVFSLRPLFFIMLILIVGVISLAVLIELGFRRGTRGPNNYGPDPLEKT